MWMWRRLVSPLLKIHKMIKAIIFHKHRLMIRATMKKTSLPSRAKAKGNVRNPIQNTYFLESFLLLRRSMYKLFCVKSIHQISFGLQNSACNTNRATFKSSRLSSVCHDNWSTATAWPQHGSRCMYTNRRSKEVYKRERKHQLPLLQRGMSFHSIPFHSTPLSNYT